MTVRSPAMLTRRYAALGGAVLVAGLLGAVGLNYAVDPLQFLRRATYAPVFSDNQRYQNPGLARNYPYDTIVTGSSLMQAFLARDVEAALGGEVLRLPINGSSAREHALLIELAHRTGRLRRVIRDVHYNNLLAPADVTKGRRGGFPMHLYDDHRWNDLVYLANFETTALSLKVVLSLWGVLPLRPVPLDKLYTDVLRRPTGRDHVAASYRRVVASRPESDDRQANVVANIEVNYARLAESMPDVKFIYVFPPYSAAWYVARLDTPGLGLEGFLAAKARFYAAMLAYPNVDIFDFQCREDFALAFDEYRDVAHFSEAIARGMIADIADGRTRVTADTYQETIDCVPDLARRSAQAVRGLLD
ncbi:MAG: hypothetical protein WD673_11210 [Alphaproteobacteria bacterium]